MALDNAGASQGAVIECSVLEEAQHFIRLRGNWDLLSQSKLAGAFALVPADCDVVVDMQEVTYCDSTILTELIRFHKHVSALGRRMDVVLGKSAVRRVFRMMHLDKVLAIRSDRTHAVEEGPS